MRVGLWCRTEGVSSSSSPFAGGEGRWSSRRCRRNESSVRYDRNDPSVGLVTRAKECSEPDKHGTRSKERDDSGQLTRSSTASQRERRDSEDRARARSMTSTRRPRLMDQQYASRLAGRVGRPRHVRAGRSSALGIPTGVHGHMTRPGGRETDDSPRAPTRTSRKVQKRTTLILSRAGRPTVASSSSTPDSEEPQPAIRPSPPMPSTSTTQSDRSQEQDETKGAALGTEDDGGEEEGGGGGGGGAERDRVDRLHARESMRSVSARIYDRTSFLDM